MSKVSWGVVLLASLFVLTAPGRCGHRHNPYAPRTPGTPRLGFNFPTASLSRTAYYYLPQTPYSRPPGSYVVPVYHSSPFAQPVVFPVPRSKPLRSHHRF
jgi:hypothetical protein